MKTKTTPLLAVAAAALLVVTPRVAVAGGEGFAAAAGFIGGMIVGSQVGSTHTHTTETVVIEHTTVPADSLPAPEAAESVAAPAPTTTTTTTTTVTRNGVPGYWEDRPVQTWVPARWITTYDRYGFPVRRYEPGHYVTHMERVWVSGVPAPVVHSPMPVVVGPAPVVVAPPPYYYSGYYNRPAIHIGVGYSHYRGGYYGGGHYRSHYPVRPLPSRPHYNGYYRNNHIPSHKANYVKGRLNSGGNSGKGLRPKFH